MRGSDPDAAVYYLARMLYAGEDIKFIARRIMICASEDVGNADPQALTVAVSAAQAVERIGMPGRPRSFFSQAVLYVATAPKSNSRAMPCSRAMDAVKKSAFHAGSGASAGLPLWWLRKTGTRNRIQIRSQLSESLRKTAVSAGWNGRTGILSSVRKTAMSRKLANICAFAESVRDDSESR